MNFLLKSIDTLPPYMEKNLKRMPCNKGYIHYGTHFYGKKKPEHDKNTIIMFEKKGYTLRIHKFYPDRIEISEKNQTTKKTKIISIEPREQLFLLDI